MGRMAIGGSLLVIGYSSSVDLDPTNLTECQSLVQATDDLADPNWQNVGGNLPGNGGELPFQVLINPLEPK